MGRQLEMILATTHVDRHRDQFTKEALEQFVTRAQATDELQWLDWEHETTLPPLGFLTNFRVVQMEDGEHALVADVDLLTEEDWRYLPPSETSMLEPTEAQLAEILSRIRSVEEEWIEISFDTANFDPVAVQPIVESINEVVPTRSRLRLRKAEVPPAVIWVLVTFASGFIAGLGKITADATVELGVSLVDRLTECFSKLLDLNREGPTDVIFQLPISGSSTHVECAVENADRSSLEYVWGTLPTLYASAIHLIEQNRRDYFSEIKFLFNPVTRAWELNYLAIRDTQRIILGPRYQDPSHPLRARFERMFRKEG